MFIKAFVIAIAAVCLSAPVLADEATPDSDGGRYTLNKVTDGFVRLDTQTGEVALCSQRTVGWACQVAPEDRAAFESEIARLRGENAALKQALLSRGLPLPSGATPERSGTHDNDITIRLPDNADIDRAVAYVNRLWNAATRRRKCKAPSWACAGGPPGRCAPACCWCWRGRSRTACSRSARRWRSSSRARSRPGSASRC